MDSQGKMPSKKVASGGLAGGLSILLVWALNELGMEVPAEVAAAIATLVSFAVGYFVPEPEVKK